MSSPESTPGRGHLTAIQGLRGLAIVLVVVSHAWIIMPTLPLLDSGFGGFFRSGNLAVTIFMVIGGYLLTTSLLRDVGSSRGLDAGRVALRRWARLSAHVYLLVIAMVLTGIFDDPAVYAPSDTRQSALRVLSYTWNWFVMRQPLLARPDAGHLWFVSVYLQVTILLIVLVKLLGRRRVLLLGTLVVAIVAVTIWRAWSADHEGLWVAFLRTSTRCDGMLWGAALAAAMPWLRQMSGAGANLLATVSGTGLLLLSFTASDDTYFKIHGVLICAATAGFLAACATGAGGPAVRSLSTRPLVVLGDVSMAVYIWHYPVFWAVSKHTPTWTWGPKTVLALVITAALAYAAQRWVERPLSGWLERARSRESAREAALRP